MKQSKSFLTRCLALALALLLVVSSANLGLVRQAFAADELSVELSELIAKNYELTAAEKALITSGYLNEVVYTYAPFDGEGLVSVDTDAKIITAEDYKGWTPAKAEIEPDGEVKEAIVFEGNTAAYTFAGNTFSVKVTYKQVVSAAADSQLALLNAAANLNAGLKDLKDAYNNSDAYIGFVVDAMPPLVSLANGVLFEALNMTLSFKTEAAKEATLALNAEMEANGGLLDMQVINAAYDSSISKTQFLHLRGEEYKTIAESTYAKLSAIAADEVLNSEVVGIYMEREGLGTAWKAFKSNLNTAIAALEPVANGNSWNTSALQSNLSGDDYLDLDAKLAAIENSTSVAISEELLAAEASVRENLSMNNVKVIVNWYQTNVAEATVETVTFVLPTGASAEIIAAEAEAVEAAVLAGWAIELYGFDREVVAPEGKLTDDIEYVINYTPKTYTVDFCGEALEMKFDSVLELVAHEDPEMAYDYTVNGESYEQGATVVIKGDTVVTRKLVKAYDTTSLYKQVAAHSDEFIKLVLLSGAVKGDEVIKYHTPESADAEGLIKFENGVVTAGNYASNYAGLSWVPYTYGQVGNEFEFSGNTGAYSGDYVNVIYKLELTNFSEAELHAVQRLAANIRLEADDQIAALERMYSQYDQLSQLDKTTLAGLNGVIDVAETLHKDPAKNAELRVYFKNIVSEIINTRLNGNKLKVLSVLENYANDGLLYYYKNYAAVIEEVSVLSELIAAMTADEEKEAALAALTLEAGKAEYYEKIAKLSGTMNEIVAGMTVPNAAIDLNSANLGKLVEALAYEDVPAGYTPVFAPIALYSPALTVADDSYAFVQMTAYVNGEKAIFTTQPIKKGELVTKEAIDALYANAEAFEATIIGEGMSQFYTHVSTTNLYGLVGKPLTEKVYGEFHVNPTYYAVMVNGEQKDITIENPWIELPVSQDPKFIYEYNIFGNAVRAANYKFTPEQLLELENGVYEIEMTVIDKQLEDLNINLDDLLESAPEGTNYEIIRDENGYVVKIVADLKADQTNLMSFATGFATLGYSYVGIGGEPLLYINDDDTIEVCLQTLLNAILADESFGSQTIIDLGNNNQGKLLTTTLELGDKISANPAARSGVASESIEIVYEFEFVLELNGVPSEMVKAAQALEGVKNYMTFKSNDGILEVTLNLPEKVYEAYLAVLLFTGDLDLSDVNAINTKIAFNFFYDYLKVITEDETVSVETFINTLERLDIAANRLGKDLPEYDLSKYGDYFTAIQEALNDDITITPNEDIWYFDCVAYGDGIKKGLSLIGIDVDAIKEANMVKELKNNDPITATVSATLKNTNSMSFEAILVDPKNDATMDKLDFEKNLAKRVAELQGPAVIMLTDDVAGELVFDHTTIIDLNGYSIGKVVANANVLILDSNLDNSKSGSIGALSGKAHLVAGHYDFPVEQYLVNGYTQNEAGYVQSMLYTMNSDDAGNLAVVLNSEFVDADVDSYIRFVAALAADLVLDQFVNYYSTAAVYVDLDSSNNFNKIFDIDFDDLVGLVSSSSPASDLVNELLSIISLPGLADVINGIMADMLDFGAIADALKNGTPVAEYQYQTQPWAINFEHVADGDYLTAGIVANEAHAKTVNLTVTFDGIYMEKLAKVFAFMDTIVLDETRIEFVDVEELVFADKHFNLVGGVEAELVLDLSDYTTAMAIVLANGTTGAKRDALVAAVNSNDNGALKVAFDAVSVADVMKALDVVNRGDDFNSLAAAVGMNVNIDLEGKKELVEKALIYTMAATGKALAKLEGIEIPDRIANIELVKYVLDRVPTVTNAVLGSLDKNNDGWYEIDGDVDGSADINYRGYGVALELTTAYAHLKVNLFDVEVVVEKYLLGDVNLDNTVDFADLTMVTRKYMEDSTQAAFNYIQEVLADVDCDGEFTFADVTVLTRYYMEDATQTWKPIYIEIPVQ